MEEEVVLKGQATEEQLAAWKKLHGDVYSVEVEGHIGYLKPMERKVMMYALSKLDISISDQGKKMNLGQMAQSGEVVLQNCWIGGSEDIRKNDDLFFAAAIEASYLVSFKDAYLKKN
jgi:hypothetical protein